MKHLKMLGLAAVAAMATMAFGAGSASADTTLEVGGEPQLGAVTITASALSGSSAILKDTAGFASNTCTASHVHLVATKAPPRVLGTLTGHTAKEKEEGRKPSDGLSFSGCTRAVTVHDPGTLTVEHIPDTTNGTVISKEAEVTVGSPIGTLNCKTGAGTHIGVLTGVASGHAHLDVNAVINCGVIPSSKWEATYVVTSPTGLGVV